MVLHEDKPPSATQPQILHGKRLARNSQSKIGSILLAFECITRNNKNSMCHHNGM